MNCKAITTKILSWTETKPTRIKASAEGVTSKIWSRDSLEGIHKKTPGTDHLNLHEFAARKFAIENNWSGALAGGGLNSDVWVHCFIPPVVPAPVSVNDTLVKALLELSNVVSHPSTKKAEMQQFAKAGYATLASAKPFLRGQELVVACARTFCAESYPSQPAKANGDKACSGYHFELLRNALVQLDEKATPEEKASRPVYDSWGNYIGEDFTKP